MGRNIIRDAADSGLPTLHKRHSKFRLSKQAVCLFGIDKAFWDIFLFSDCTLKTLEFLSVAGCFMFLMWRFKHNGFFCGIFGIIRGFDKGRYMFKAEPE